MRTTEETLQDKEYRSELSRIVNENSFTLAYSKFMEQAENNVITQKAHGPRVPFGFSKQTIVIDGGDFHQHFGQGTASKTPYMNWWVVSIYYLVESGRILIGIEKDRYPYVKKMKPLKYERIGNKKVDVAVFYSTSKNTMNASELYDQFIEVAEKVMRLGLK